MQATPASVSSTLQATHKTRSAPYREDVRSPRRAASVSGDGEDGPGSKEVSSKVRRVRGEDAEAEAAEDALSQAEETREAVRQRKRGVRWERMVERWGGVAVAVLISSAVYVCCVGEYGSAYVMLCSGSLGLKLFSALSATSWIYKKASVHNVYDEGKRLALLR
jgi:hypothetical protein